MKIISLSNALMERYPERREPVRHSVRLNDGSTGQAVTFAAALAQAIEETVKNDKGIENERKNI